MTDRNLTSPATRTAALTVWRRGVSFFQSRTVLVPDGLRRQWKDAHATSLIETIHSEARRDGADLSSLMATLSEVATPRAEAARACQAHLVAELRAGRLVGLGFEAPRRLASTPVVIAREHWRGAVFWSTDELRSQRLRFVEIRVLPLADARSIADAWSREALPAHQSPRRGPRSSATDIAEAFEALMAGGQINFDASAKSHFPMIRAWLSHRRSDAGYTDTRLSDETIRRTFAPMWREAKARREN